MIQLIFVLIGASLGTGLLPGVWKLLGDDHWKLLDNSFTNGSLGAIIFLFLSFAFAGNIVNGLNRADKKIAKISLQALLFGGLGFLIGLLAGALLSLPLFFLNIPVISTILPIILIVLLAYFGLRVGISRKEELVKTFVGKKKTQVDIEEPQKEELVESELLESVANVKLLDTSVIIDGRIYDIAKTGFLEGTIVIPNFVLFELQKISDSSDNLKRVRGRRGLDILNALQKLEDVEVEMYEGDFDDITEVDEKLLKLGRMWGAAVVTNDFNLNKVAQFQKVSVLNINELANAVKPVVIPGEAMTVTIVKSGTERSQGVAYLDDGTMIVVEDGQHFMNKELKVVVTSVIQTNAGKMIFAKPTHSTRTIENREK